MNLGEIYDDEGAVLQDESMKHRFKPDSNCGF